MEIVIALVSAGVGLVGLVLAYIGHRRNRPKVRVVLETCVGIGGDPQWHGRSLVQVTATNHGGSPVQIQGATLRSRLGWVYAKEVTRTRGTLQPHGGRAVWFADRQDLRDCAAEGANEEQVEFRAIVKSGSKGYESRAVEMVHPLEPTQQPKKKESMAVRAKRKWASLFRPRLQLVGAVIPSTFDFEAGTYAVAVRNFGGGVGFGAKLELHSSKVQGVPGSRQRRISEPRPLPPILRGRQKMIVVPFAESESCFWYLRQRGLVSVGVGAMTRESAQQFLRTLEHLELESSEVGNSTERVEEPDLGPATPTSISGGLNEEPGSISKMSDDNPYEPTGCRVCGQPVQVIQVKDERASGTFTRLVRRCNNPACRLNNGDARASDAP